MTTRPADALAVFAVMVAVVAHGCATTEACNDAAVADVDAGVDAAVAADSGTARRDGGRCDSPSAELYVAPLMIARSPGDVDSCRPGEGPSFRVRIFPVGGTAPVYDVTSDCANAGNIGLASPGTYDLLVESGEHAAGAAVVDSTCDRDASGSPYCRRQRFVLAPCAVRTIAVAVYCDAREPDCDGSVWPWGTDAR